MLFGERFGCETNVFLARLISKSWKLEDVGDVGHKSKMILELVCVR